MGQSASQAKAFYSEVEAKGVVYTIRDEGGYPAPISSQGVRAMPFWSSESRVQKIISSVEAYKNFEPVEVEVSHFHQYWLNELEAKNQKVGINWSGAKATGYDLEPMVLKKWLEQVFPHLTQNKQAEAFSLIKRLKSFRFAIEGIKVLIEQEHNFRIHITAAIFVIIMGFLFQISPLEWIALIFCIGLVLITEAINTAIEGIANFISPEKNPKIKIIKDIAAATVLISAITACAVGVIIFWPYKG
jgi:diacylglycerol kinase